MAAEESCRRRYQVRHTLTHLLQRGLTGTAWEGKKGQMGIFANATLVADRSHPRELSLGAK